MLSRQESYAQGKLYFEQADYDKAIPHLLKAAGPKKGLLDSSPHPEACALLAVTYIKKSDTALSFYWLKIAETLSLQKSSQEQNNLFLGLGYLLNEEYDTALKYLKGISSWYSIWLQAMTAELGGNLELAEQHYLKALSITPEDTQASVLYTLIQFYSTHYPNKAIEQLKNKDRLSSAAFVEIGKMYYLGKPVYLIEQNYDLARQCFTAATKVKDDHDAPKAYFYLGLMQMYGHGDIQNFTAAEDYFRQAKACQKFRQQGSAGLGFMSRFEGLGEQQNAQRAIKHFKQALLHEKSDLSAKINLAEMHVNGEGVEKNSAIATALFMEIFNADKDDLMSVAQTYLTGIGINKNLNKAKLWLNLAKAKGNHQAEKILALIRDDGKQRAMHTSLPVSQEQQFLEQLELHYRITPTKLPFINELRKINTFVETLSKTWPYGYGAKNHLKLQFDQNKNILILEGGLYSADGINTLLKIIAGITKQDSDKYKGMFKGRSVHAEFLAFSEKFNPMKSPVGSSSQSLISQLLSPSASASSSRSTSPGTLASSSSSTSSSISASPSRSTSSSTSASSSSSISSNTSTSFARSQSLYCSGLPPEEDSAPSPAK